MKLAEKDRLIQILSFVFFICCNSCNFNEQGKREEMKPLPYYGEFDVSGNDTVYHPIPKFSMLNQDSVYISDDQFKGKIVVADFFFTSCPSICPVISAQMARLQDLIKKENLDSQVKMLSHTVDPLHDGPAVLKNYGTKIGADFSIWTFVTADPDYMYWQAQKGYQLTAFPSDTAQGGFFHTDKVVLLDQEMKIRGYYDGTSTKSMDELFIDLHQLIPKQ
jgi:protein SCO1/2